MSLQRFTEYEIEPNLHEEITALKNECFPEEAKDRSYYKQLPHFRYLAFDKEQLIGQMGVDHRMIMVGTEVVSIFGLIDVCISEEFRQQGIASEMIDEVSDLAKSAEIDFLMLVADDHRLYLKNGFRPVSALVS